MFCTTTCRYKVVCTFPLKTPCSVGMQCRYKIVCTYFSIGDTVCISLYICTHTAFRMKQYLIHCPCGCICSYIQDLKFSSFMVEFKNGKDRAKELLSNLPHIIPHCQVRTQSVHAYIRASTYVYIRTYIGYNILSYIRTYVHTLCIQYICTYILSYICTYMHTYIHTVHIWAHTYM